MSSFAEAVAMFALSLLLAIMAILNISSDHGWALVFAILSAAAGAAAFWVIFADIARTEKTSGNRPVARK